MSLTLKIISYQRLTPGQQESFQSNLDKFSIGRNPDNDWPLHDPQRFMSGTHCQVENRNGVWVLTDTSTNGVFINNSDQRVAKGDSVELKQGDQIRLGDYDLQVDLDAGSSAGISPPSDIDPFLDNIDDTFAAPEPPQPATLSEPKAENTPLSQMDNSLLGDAVSIDSLYQFDDAGEKAEEPPTLASRGNQGSPMEQHFSAPRVEQAPDNSPAGKYAADFDDIPDNWDDETGLVQNPGIEKPDPKPTPASAPPAPLPEPTTSAPKPAPEYSARPSSGHSGGGSALAAFARGARLDPNQLQVDDQEAFFQDLGALLETMTHGLMQAIASRSQVKSEFRLEQTMIAPTENNPFKFSVSPQEAMMRLINRSDHAYLSGIAAAAEAVDDINAHQLAVMAGTEAALKSILRRFNPRKLESKFGKDSSLRNSVAVLKKARYWDFYTVLYDEISSAVDDDFQQLFGAEFSSAYEEQLDRLKLSRKEPSR